MLSPGQIARRYVATAGSRSGISEYVHANTLDSVLGTRGIQLFFGRYVHADECGLSLFIQTKIDLEELVLGGLSPSLNERGGGQGEREGPEQA